MSELKIVGRGVDTLVLNVRYADKQFQAIKQELNADLQEVLSTLQDEQGFSHFERRRIKSESGYS